MGDEVGGNMGSASRIFVPVKTSEFLLACKAVRLSFVLGILSLKHPEAHESRCMEVFEWLGL